MKKQKHKGGNKRRAQKTAQRKRNVAAKKHAEQSAASDMARAKAAASNFGVSHCMMGEGLFEAGIGTVLLARTMSLSKVAVAVFLIDVYCLGIKDATYQEISHAELHHLIASAAKKTAQPFADIEPEYTRKLVEDAAGYARELGFAPHKDYAAAKALFGDIDVSKCDEEFVFGKDGGPFYVSGPFDTPAKIRKILNTLEQNVGEENFYYLLAGDGGF